MVLVLGLPSNLSSILASNFSVPWSWFCSGGGVCFTLISLFLAVKDEVLAPMNLEEIGWRLPPNCSGSETLDMAKSLVAARHSGERILRCWGGGTGWIIEDAKDKIGKLLEEYEIGGVLSEACRCIRELDMPFFSHEVVKRALVMAIENNNDKMLDLLDECYCEALITTNQLTKGFTRVSDTIADLALDIPGAEERFNNYVGYAQKKGWLLPSYGSSDTDSPLLSAAAC
ncbi:hypothetical protein DCAR_0729211 [Daucus carota subsp. sativus]|uniref:MI domain-containing protein n=1 Tax=Daucus carota subsp. sativus TaxID=79200 RepID=A0AAF0XKJ7_DAUCS|nr:hypothetical protein DCAR_0729211 [Daucus carota subsp. sativus]